MTTFVLVHGAWSGAHCFRKVRPLLRTAGHEVFTPCLTGVGERVHLASPQVDLSTHVRDLVNLILYEDLADIVLLGFSYGGMVVSGALEHIGERVRSLVFLDAFVPKDGDSLLSLNGFSPQATIKLGQPWLTPPVARDYDDPADTAFETPRRVPHPAACFVEPVRLSRKIDDYAFTRMYIKATADAADAPGAQAFGAAAAHARASSAWSYREIASNHMVPTNRPAELAELLLQLG